VLFLLRPRQAWMPFTRPVDSMPRPPAPYVPPHPPTSPDPAARLRQLGELHQSGALTDHEFATAKAQVLGED
jgi:Short C-terminal domain